MPDMCYDDNAQPPMPLSENSAAHGDEIELTASDGTRVAAYLATPGGQADAQALILPDVRGLHRFYKELALRFADVGYRALAIDYFARTAPDRERNGEFEYMPHVEKMTPETFGADLDAAVDYIRSGEGEGVPTFTVGFCMGGSRSFWAGTRGYDLAGVIGFYAGLSRARGGFAPVIDFAAQIASPVLGLFGGADQGIPEEDRQTFERALKEGGVEHEIVVYPGAPHSFFDRRATDFADASADAWSRVQGFIAGHSLTRV
jgi:carboxymethylenebutenolidase